MNKNYYAVLVRGLIINLIGKPFFVLTDTTGKIPDNALKVELNSNESEENTANKLRESYEIWKKTITGIDGKVLLPACIALIFNDNTEAIFWIGSDLDSTKKWLNQKDDSPLIETSEIIGATINTAQRANVVKNKIALVTGGAQGIGEEIVRNLAAAGAFVFIADLNIEGAQKLAEQINVHEKRIAAIAVEVNVTNEESVEAMFNTIAQTTGGLDICISNAGVLKAGSVLEQDIADFKFVTDINYTGFFVISKFAGRLLRTQHLTALNWKTDIIQVNSKSGLEGSNKNGAYAGGKFGGIGLVASFAKELIEYGIKVNAVCPGNFLDGPLWSDPDKGLFVQYLRTGKVPGAKSIADVRASYESRVPMKRGCTGVDLARAIFYIIEQEYETGQAVPVTGGQVMLH